MIRRGSRNVHAFLVGTPLPLGGPEALEDAILEMPCNFAIAPNKILHLILPLCDRHKVWTSCDPTPHRAVKDAASFGVSVFRGENEFLVAEGALGPTSRRSRLVLTAPFCIEHLANRQRGSNSPWAVPLTECRY